ncbi:Palmitoyltransferase ZDHHC3 [Cryptosporidium felis]|nr:Palmitoyltransferase ZDHHC3 [Cryptosporidium felis]
MDQITDSGAETYFHAHSYDQNLHPECKITPLVLILGLTVIVESLIFGIFCIAMFIDQIICIINNTTGIEHLKQEYLYSKKKGAYSLFVEVCGSRFSWKWFFPTKTRSPFTVNNFDLSMFIDVEFSDFILDPECGQESNIQNSGFKNDNLTKKNSLRARANNLDCLLCCRGFDSTNVISTISEDFSIFENDNDVRNIPNPRIEKMKEILMDDLQKHI